jgi:carboxymethylenebutenolidase
LQEWWGINDTIKNHAQRIANNTGARTVVPDLYKGKIGLTAEVRRKCQGVFFF